MKTIYLRPHHGLCVILFSSAGHSAPYSAIMLELIEALKSDPRREIALCSDPDAICGYCPHNHDGVCGKSDEVSESDANILLFCGLEQGRRLPWNDFQQILIDGILKADVLEQACKGCQYLSQCDGISKQRI